jgi:hypothetical protein
MCPVEVSNEISDGLLVNGSNEAHLHIVFDGVDLRIVDSRKWVESVARGTRNHPNRFFVQFLFPPDLSRRWFFLLVVLRIYDSVVLWFDTAFRGGLISIG